MKRAVKRSREIFGIHVFLSLEPKMRDFMRKSGVFYLDDNNSRVLGRISWEHRVGVAQPPNINRKPGIGAMFVVSANRLDSVLEKNFKHFLELTFLNQSPLEKEFRKYGEWEIVVKEWNDNFYVVDAIWTCVYGEPKEKLHFNTKRAKKFMGERSSYLISRIAGRYDEEI